MPRQSGRNAFTLLELLVVIGIVGFLMGMLLCAVQKVRQSAARLECLSNLEQMGLALHQYHDANHAFPAGCSYSAGADPFPHVSWMARILPYLEQEALWQQAVRAFAQTRFFQNAPHRPILERTLRAFACHADGRVSRSWDFGTLQVGLTSYQGVSGTDRASFDGVLYFDSRARLTDVADGASNTLMVGERPPSHDGRLGWWYAGWGQDRDGSADLHLGVHEVNVMARYVLCGADPFSFGRGDVTNPCDVFHFWSLHPGGANFLFADGSARLLRYESAALPALGTRAGGEVTP